MTRGVGARSPRKLLLASLVCAAWACTPQLGQPGGGIGDAAIGPMPADGGLEPSPLGYAVVSGDYAVASIGLLDHEGRVLQRVLIDSGSASTGLVTALSGDVVVPAQTGERGVLVVLDRFRTDVLTRIDLASGEVLGQVKTHADDPAGGYSSNPQDYVYFGPTEAWITRFEPKLGAGADDPDRGCDLYRVDPTGFERSGERIGFERWHTEATRRNPDTGAMDTVTVYARPSALVRVDERRVVVGIERLSRAFDAAADSLLALVDLDSAQLSALPLDGLQSCGSVSVVPDDPRRLVVGCTGFYRGVARDAAGIAVVHYDGQRLELERLWRARDDPSSALTMYGVRAVSATEVLAVEAGAAEVREDGELVTPETKDRLFRVDLVTGEQTLLFEAAGRYVLGGASFDPRTGLALLPDASTDRSGRPSAGVRRLRLDAQGKFEPDGVERLDELLPARRISPFR